MHELSVSLLRAKQLPVITNGLGASPHAGSTCTIGVVTVRPLNRLPARLYFKLKPDPNNTFFFIFTCTTQYPWVLANLNLSQAMAPSKKKRIHTVFRDSSAHRSASTSKPRFVGEKVKLGELISKAKVERCGDRSFPVYSMTMHDGIVEQSGRFKKTIASRDTSSYKVVKKNQLVVGFPIDEGVIYVQNHDQPGIMSPAYNVWDFDSDRILPAYLEFVLHSPQSMAYYAEKMRGTTARRRTLTGDALKNMPVPVPSIEDQYAVVKALNCIKSQLAATQQMLDKLDQLGKSRFVEMFGELDTNPKGFQLTCFDDLGTWTSGGTPSRKNPSYFTGEIDWYSAGELNSLHLGRSKERISLRAIEESSAKLVPPGSLFVGMYDTAALKMGITTKESSSNQACANLVPNGIVDLVWLYFAIDQLKPSLLAKRSGCRQKNLSLKKIKSFMVPLPDLDSQQGFSRFVAQVDKSRFVRDHEMNFR